MRVPLVDLGAQQAEVAEEVRQGLDRVFAATAFIGGSDVEEFEQAYAAETGVAHCVGVGNGTDALELALRGAGVGPGGEVILPANTFIATAEAVSRIGATPVLVDVDPTHLLIDPHGVAEAVTTRTQAIVPVHLFGQMAPMERIARIAAPAGIPVVEDAAQSQGAVRHGSTSGGVGLVAATSFYPGKNLGAAGDAGAVTTNDPDIARAIRVLAAHGSPAKYVHDVIGMNSRLDTVQAVVLKAKLRRLAGWNENRRKAAELYDSLLWDLPGIARPESAPGNTDVWHLYVVQVDRRDAVLETLHAEGIGAGIHYPTPVHLTRAYAHLGLGRGCFPVAEAAAGRILSLPMFPHISPEQQEYVAASLAAATTLTRGAR
ncbi:DegT/DnrJ/EryC1/StrS family aminotransferase [Aeromicrobium wangtongii]|uniref:DegT/DnrJ/EryC1/StrS family aminotransferase n=1 Tax=Aeromicrobium wangtongii TaxID=2969247 RepID=A0ABY5MCF9_9ACTN|nr:DegT/DnrJ/EryC1/StrS family aminotransferase [Aeromicrobium wangtongii]MCD9196891.1 DegT/DnrJ/EryC1/StrS family aminotransferase [Aeromicrobium wangtongii]UUP14397.1 DegT/DnrJ/EryC1/StrS family aminotransferase [Aeromicrobium wangtongii]